MQEKLNFVLLSIWSHIPIDLSVWASNIVYQREIWSLPTGAVDTIFHGQSRITGKIARKNDKNKSLSLKLKYFLIAGAHNLKLMCSATYCNMTTNTPCFSRLPIDLTWQPVSAWHHASFWNRKRFRVTPAPFNTGPHHSGPAHSTPAPTTPAPCRTGPLPYRPPTLPAPYWSHFMWI